MDTLACSLVQPTSAFLQQATVLLLQRSTVINNKAIRSLARSLQCPGVDKNAILSTVSRQLPIWASGAAASADGGSVGVATQNILSLLSSQHESASQESRDTLLGDGCLSDPFILAGIYDTLLRTPVLSPTCTEFAFASTPHDASLIHDALFAQKASASAKSTKKSPRGKPVKKAKKGPAQQSVFILGADAPLAEWELEEVSSRVAPLLKTSIEGAAATEFSSVVAASKGGFTLDHTVAKPLEELRERLWHSMYRRGEATIGMFTGARGLRGTPAQQADGRSQMREPSGATGVVAAGSYDFTDPDVVAYIWRMICSCNRRDRIEALLRRFPMLGNNLLHPPVNTSGVGGAGVGASVNSPLSPKTYAKTLHAIHEAPCREYLVSLMDFNYMEGVLLSAIEESQRDSLREWSTEAMIALHRLRPLSSVAVGRMVSSLAKKPLVSLGLPSANEIFDTSLELVLDPVFEPLVEHVETQLCDAFWNVTRMSNATTVLTGLHASFNKLHKKHLVAGAEFHGAQRAQLEKRLGSMLFQNFTSRLAQDPIAERSAACQSTFASVAGVLGCHDACDVSTSALRGILAFQQAQFESLSTHMDTARASLLSGPKRNTLRALSMDPQASGMPKELLVRMHGASAQLLPDEGLADDAAAIQSYSISTRLTSNSVVQGMLEASGCAGKALVGSDDRAVPIQQRVFDGEVAPTFSAHLLGPQPPGADAAIVSRDYVAKAASARMLATTMIHPQLAVSHGWHSFACAALIDHFSLRDCVAESAKTKGKGKSPSKGKKTKQIPASAASPVTHPRHFGYTVPICRALVLNYEHTESFRTSLAAEGVAVGKFQKHTARLPFLGISDASLPIVRDLESVDTMVKSATQCAMDARRSISGEFVAM